MALLKNARALTKRADYVKVRAELIGLAADLSSVAARLLDELEGADESPAAASANAAAPDLTLQEVAAELRCSVDTVRRMVKRKELDTVPCGKRGVRVPRASLDGYKARRAGATLSGLGRATQAPCLRLGAGAALPRSYLPPHG